MGRMTEGEIAEARRLKIRKIMLRRPACKALRWGARSAAFDLALSELPDRIWVE